MDILFPDFIVELDEYTIDQKLGEGAHAYVYSVIEKKTGNKFAAKISKSECIKSSEQKIFFQELTVLSKISNPGILSLVGFNLSNFEKEHHPTIIIPYMPNGSLNQLIKNNPTFPLSKKYIILLGIAEGMKYLHSQGIIHRDLKPGNVLLDMNFYPHIGDFGESKISEINHTSILMESCKGSPAFMAPEIFTDEPYTYKTDIYSYAILMYMLITGKDPYPRYKTQFKLYNAISKGERPDLSLINNEYIKMLLMRCWSIIPDERPDFNTIVEELKEEQFRNSMEADYNEVSDYLSLFGEKLENTVYNLKTFYDDESSIPTFNSIISTNVVKSTPYEATTSSFDDLINLFEYEDPITKKVTELNFKIEADKGNVTSMIKYANMLKNGDGIEVNKVEAARYYKMAADRGNDYAMSHYAFMLQQGDGILVNKAEAARYYKMAADKGNNYAMNSLAIMLQQGDGILINKAEAARYFKMAADKGNEAAMNSYAYMLQQGDGILVNKEEAARYYKMAADKGNDYAANSYAYMLQQGDGILVNKEEAARYYKIAADKGNEAAMNSYAIILQQGDGVEINKLEAARYYKMAIRKGNIYAMYNFALMLKSGDGIPINKTKAARYFKMAADKGNDSAMNNFAVILQNGDGVTVNKSEAARYFKMAADKGNDSAMNCYAIILQNGDGVTSNIVEAIRYYKMAIDKGNVYAMFNYATILQAGFGVITNKLEAARYYKMAADKGNKSAMLRYANMLQNGDGIPVNQSEATHYFKMAAKK